MDIESKLMEALHSNREGYISGAEIADELGITRTAIWKHIEAIRNNGYDIEAVPHLGYRLLKVPDRLIPREIEMGLETEIIGKNIVTYRSCSSTSDIAEEKARSGAEEGTVIFAEYQTKGRGRLGRTWLSEKSMDLLCSVILRPGIHPSSSSILTVSAALSICEMLRHFGLSATIKWPNDVMIKNKKIGGVLTEIKTEADIIDYAVMGIGVNINSEIRKMGPDIRKTATSVFDECGHKADRIEAGRNLLSALDRKYRFIRSKNPGCIIKEYIDYSSTLGNVIDIKVGSAALHGYAQGFDDTGALIIRRDDNSIEKVISGELI
ncbi:MAG: biotin--[acetyl-CoA-carboxylase] ligase [bacterium]|nr:biotin--[acetyl-CoA-carboxylase] ligase [bacterium]